MQNSNLFLISCSPICLCLTQENLQVCCEIKFSYLSNIYIIVKNSYKIQYIYNYIN